jgi:LysM repeat protein
MGRPRPGGANLRMRRPSDHLHGVIGCCTALLLLAGSPALAGDAEGTDPTHLTQVPDPSPEPAAQEAPAGVSDLERVRQLAAEDPVALGPLSIGAPGAGLLFNPVAFEPGPLWTLLDPRSAFATRETIDFVTAAILAVEARFPGSPPLCVGAISRMDGGRLDRHRSHQTGRDVDLGFYFRSGDVSGLVKGTAKDLDLDRTWALVRALITETDVDKIFLDRSIQRLLYDHALAQGEDRAWLNDIFGRSASGQDAIVQHERRHQDHLHVRFFNQVAQELGRLAYPVLVATHLVPGPTISHQVRPGETLSHLAHRYGTSAEAIRTANGLRGSLLTVGRRYLIPVRRVPQESAAIVVPPRRLPPEPAGVAEEAPGLEAAPPGSAQP